MKKKLLLIVILCLSVILFKSDVNADTNTSPGAPTSETSKCNVGNKCWFNVVGLRVTFIKYENNQIKRCKYDSTTKTLCGTSGNNLKSIDYWASGGEHIGFTNKDFCYAYKDKLTKYERIGHFNTGYDLCKNNYDSKVKSLSDAGFEFSGDTFYARNLYNTIKKFDNDLKSETSDHKYSKKILNNLLKHSTGDNNITIDKINISSSDAEKMYIQFDQLLHVSHYTRTYNPDYINEGIATIGTVAETSYLLMNKTNNYSRQCITRENSLGGDANVDGCLLGQGILYTYGGWTGFYGTESGGGNLGKTVTAITGFEPNTNLSEYQKLDEFTKNDTANVSHVWIRDLIQKNDCPKVADINGAKVNDENIGIKASKYSNANNYGKALNEYLSEKGEKTYPWLNNAILYGFKDGNDVRDYILENSSCEKPSCGTAYKNYTTNAEYIRGLYNVTNARKQFIEVVLKGNLYPEYTKGSDQEWNINTKIKFDNVVGDGSLTFGIKNNEVCEAYTCEKVLDKAKENNLIVANKKYKNYSAGEKNVIKALNALFPGNAYLDEEFLKEMDEVPACGGTIPDCSVDKSLSCDGKITIGKNAVGDAEYKACITSGFLYTQGGIKTSKRMAYSNILSTSGYSVYCSESIVFDMPKGDLANIITAGEIYKWGVKILNDTDKKKFARMTVTQQCYKAKSTKPSGAVSLTKAEAKRLTRNLTNDTYPNNGNLNNIYRVYDNNKTNSSTDNSQTEITIDYSDPTNTYLENNKSLNRSFNTNGSYFSVSKDGFTIKSVYDFSYGDSLTWYAKKGSDNAKSISKTEYNGKNAAEKNSYTFIGYGLPTSLSTPDGTYSGRVKAKIKNAGISGKFDNLFSSTNGIIYDCPFKVHNELFGNECCYVDSNGVIHDVDNAPSYCGTCNGDGTQKGIDVVFRTIELTKANPSSAEKSKELAKAFPGRTGGNTARKIGRNWQEVVDNNTVYSILDDSVYTKSPRYSIKLNSTNISKIRDYNKSARNARVSGENVDPYTYLGTVTGSESNGFIGYKCDSSKDAYGYCVSNFLEKLRSSLGLKGTCMTRSPDINTRLSRGVCGQ